MTDRSETYRTETLPLKIAAAVFAIHFLLLSLLWSSWNSSVEQWVAANMQNGIIRENSPPPPTGPMALNVLMFPFVSMAIVRTGGVFSYFDQAVQSGLWGMAAFFISGGKIRLRKGPAPTPGG